MKTTREQQRLGILRFTVAIQDDNYSPDLDLISDVLGVPLAIVKSLAEEMSREIDPPIIYALGTIRTTEVADAEILAVSRSPELSRIREMAWTQHVRLGIDTAGRQTSIRRAVTSTGSTAHGRRNKTESRLAWEIDHGAAARGIEAGELKLCRKCDTIKDADLFTRGKAVCKSCRAAIERAR